MDGMHVMSLIQILGNLAYFLVACSFMVRDIFWLRFLSIIASVFSIYYSTNVALTPLWVPISWNLFFLTLNFYHITKLIYGSRKIILNEKEQELHQIAFPQLNLMEFSKLIRMGEWKKVDSNQILVQENQPMENLLMIYNGRVDILIKENNNDKKINELKDGQFVGEMSFLSNRPAAATVKTVHPTEYVSWKQKDLKDLIGRNPSLLFSLQAAMGTQVAEALKDKNVSGI